MLHAEKCSERQKSFVLVNLQPNLQKKDLKCLRYYMFTTDVMQI